MLTILEREGHELSDDAVFEIIVADGMGGERLGEFASRVALESLSDLARNATSWVMKFTNFEAQ
ncbi:hypothetical protein NG895_09165 [Aeoliella sp. ICT_H6.2]|uniref:Uncharacterized protein n=1 Tax=Aeoliella straminimaris TaxID=2954799 RepID=A0A9X2F9K1_9BACT|nr:hypothetical protein [Aeoliella straminimaris]MCO6044077.1 hypothetical protein [Aeoliella straminimaris]